MTKPTIKRSSPKTDRDIATNIAQGFGSLVSWGYPRNWTASPTAINEAFANVELDITVEPLSDQHCISVACGMLKKFVEDGVRYRAEVSSKTEEEITITIQKQEGDRKTSWQSVEMIVWNVELGDFTDAPETTCGQQVIAKTHFKKQNFQPMEFSRYVMNPIIKQSHAIKLQDISGLYYVIETYLPYLAKVRVATDSLNVRFRNRALVADNENKTEMAQVAEDSLMDRIEEVQETLKKWESKSKVRKTSQDALNAELEAIKDECSILCEALGFATDTINQAIKDAENTAKKLVEEKDENVSSDTDIINLWKSLLNSDTLLVENGDEKVYSMTISDAVEGGINKSTTKNYYFNDGQIHARALAELGYFGIVQSDEIVIQTI